MSDCERGKQMGKGAAAADLVHLVGSDVVKLHNKHARVVCKKLLEGDLVVLLALIVNTLFLAEKVGHLARYLKCRCRD